MLTVYSNDIIFMLTIHSYNIVFMLTVCLQLNTGNGLLMMCMLPVLLELCLVATGQLCLVENNSSTGCAAFTQITFPRTVTISCYDSERRFHAPSSNHRTDKIN